MKTIILILFSFMILFGPATFPQEINVKDLVNKKIRKALVEGLSIVKTTKKMSEMSEGELREKLTENDYNGYLDSLKTCGKEKFWGHVFYETKVYVYLFLDVAKSDVKEELPLLSFERVFFQIEKNLDKSESFDELIKAIEEEMKKAPITIRKFQGFLF